MTSERSILLDSGSAALLMWDTGEDGLVAEPWDGNSLVRVTEYAAEEGVFIDTGDQYGPFSVTTTQLDAEPALGAGWEDVVEFSVTTGRSLEISEPEDRYPSVTLVDGPGTYRVRVSARGRARNDFSNDDADAGEEPLESYLIEAWPAPPSPPQVVRLTSQHALSELAGPPPKPVIPEAEAGIAAAARIGRDVDGQPGARHLSGATGTAKVERTIRGNRRKLFRSFAMVINWTRLWDPEDGLGWVYGGDGDPFEIGVYYYGYGGPDDVDQLCGSAGRIRTAFVEHKRPAYAVRTWEWTTRPPGDRVHRSAWRSVLPQPTRLTLRLHETKDDGGDPWTTVTLEHDLLPVEWVEDMTDWWNFQFAIADHRGFGTK